MARDNLEEVFKELDKLKNRVNSLSELIDLDKVASREQELEKLKVKVGKLPDGEDLRGYVDNAIKQAVRSLGEAGLGERLASVTDERVGDFADSQVEATIQTMIGGTDDVTLHNYPDQVRTKIQIAIRIGAMIDAELEKFYADKAAYLVVGTAMKKPVDIPDLRA